MVRLEIGKVGNSLGVTFPKGLLEELNVGEGDELYLLRTERGFELMPYNPELVKEIAAYRHVTRRHRNALRALFE